MIVRYVRSSETGGLESLTAVILCSSVGGLDIVGVYVGVGVKECV